MTNDSGAQCRWRNLAPAGHGLDAEFRNVLLCAVRLALFARLRPVAFVAPILMALALLSLVRTPEWPVPLYFFADPVVLDFLAGMLLAQWTRAGLRLPGWLAWPVIAGALVWLFVPLPPLITGDTPYAGLVNSLGRTLASAGLILGEISVDPRLGGNIPRPVLFMGAASYSLYLIHPIVAPAAPHLLAKLGWQLPWLAIPASVAIAIVAAAIAYRWFEMPVARLTGRLAKRFGLMDPGPPVAPVPISAEKGSTT